MAMRQPDQGRALTKEIYEGSQRIRQLEEKITRDYPPEVTRGAADAGGLDTTGSSLKQTKMMDFVPNSGKALHNSAWQAYREGLNTFGSGPNPYANDKLWAGGPAANALYGGRMNADRRMEVVTVTQVI